MIRHTYPEGFKRSMVQKMLSPGGPSLSELAEKHEVGPHNLRRWRRKYSKHIEMKNDNKKEWGPEEKLSAIIKTSTMKEEELGEFLRKNGLHSVQIEQWKNEFLAAMNDSSQKRYPGRPRKDAEVYELRSKEKVFEKEIRRKDKALAELSARIVLLKKSRLIFGGDEEEE